MRLTTRRSKRLRAYCGPAGRGNGRDGAERDLRVVGGVLTPPAPSAPTRSNVAPIVRVHPCVIGPSSRARRSSLDGRRRWNARASRPVPRSGRRHAHPESKSRAGIRGHTFGGRPSGRPRTRTAEHPQISSSALQTAACFSRTECSTSARADQCVIPRMSSVRAWRMSALGTGEAGCTRARASAIEPSRNRDRPLASGFAPLASIWAGPSRARGCAQSMRTYLPRWADAAVVAASGGASRVRLGLGQWVLSARRCARLLLWLGCQWGACCRGVSAGRCLLGRGSGVGCEHIGLTAAGGGLARDVLMSSLAVRARRHEPQLGAL